MSMVNVKKIKKHFLFQLNWKINDRLSKGSYSVYEIIVNNELAHITIWKNYMKVVFNQRDSDNNIRIKYFSLSHRELNFLKLKQI